MQERSELATENGLSSVITDPNLIAIITTALANNRDVRVAQAAIASARAQARLSEAQRLPTIEVLAGFGGVIGNGSDRFSAGAAAGPLDLDLFGRLRSLSQAAFDRALAAEASGAATRLSLVVDIASTYYALAADRTLLILSRRNQEDGRQALRLTDERFKAGFASLLDVRQARTILDQALADEQEQLASIEQDRNALERLVGSPIDPALLPTSIEAVEAVVRSAPAGLNSSILLRRPDVIQAEYLLRADSARIGAARAAFFPNIGLTAALGTASSALGSFLGRDTNSGSLGGSGLLTIFDAGANRARLADARAQRDASLARYEGTIQQAFREVADALAREQTIVGQLRAQEQLVADTTGAAELNELRYRAGIDSFLDTLVSRRASYAAQRSLALTRQTRALNRVALFGSLGGNLEGLGNLRQIPTTPVK